MLRCHDASHEELEDRDAHEERQPGNSIAIVRVFAIFVSASVDSRTYAAGRRRALMNSHTTGSTDTKMMMMATAEKFCFTIGMLPKR
jgi:hypothetical protein